MSNFNLLFKQENKNSDVNRSPFQGRMMMRICTNYSILFITLCVILSGCSPSVNGGPDLSDYRSFSEGYFKDGYSHSRVNAYLSETDSSSKQMRRNSIVLSAIGSIDAKYAAFEDSMTREGQQIPFLADLASLGLSGAGTLVASSATKTALAAVDTGLKGAKSAYDTNILAEKTVQFLQKQMRTNRNKVRSGIIEKLALSVERYPLELAMLDIERYAAAGTVTAGLMGIDEQTSQALTQSEDLRVTEIASYGADDATSVIRAYLNAGGQAAQARVQNWLRGKNRQVSTWLFLNGAEFADLRREFVKELS